MGKIDWNQLFLEYVNGESSIADVLSEHGISPNCGGSKSMTAKWGTKKAQIRHEIAELARKKAIETGADALAIMDDKLFKIGTKAILALDRYVNERKVLTPQETRTIFEMILIRMNKPTRYIRQEQMPIPDILSDDVLESLTISILNS